MKKIPILFILILAAGGLAKNHWESALGASLGFGVGMIGTKLFS